MCPIDLDLASIWPGWGNFPWLIVIKLSTRILKYFKEFYRFSPLIQKNKPMFLGRVKSGYRNYWEGFQLKISCQERKLSAQIEILVMK
jgi:hypothetical protein